MRALATKNNFHYHKDRTQKVETIKLTNNEEVRLLNQYSNNNVIKFFIFFDLTGKLYKLIGFSNTLQFFYLLFFPVTEMAVTFD